MSNNYVLDTDQPTTKKRKRVFLWVFLGIQILFIIWVIAGTASSSHSGASAHTQAIQYCHANWRTAFYASYDSCVTQYGNTLNDASDAGKGIGVGLVIGLWCAVDIIVGGSYAVYRLARRSR
jgi:hypothetical protein